MGPMSKIIFDILELYLILYFDPISTSQEVIDSFGKLNDT